MRIQCQLKKNTIFTIFISYLGKSPDDETTPTPLSLGQCPVPCPVVSSEAMPRVTASRWLLVISIIAGEMLVAGFLVKNL